MDRVILRRLELLNQLSLTETQKDEVIAFFADRENDAKVLENIDTSNAINEVNRANSQDIWIAKW